MKLKTLSIKNFRNFEDISITLSNKNVVFGMNDVGKTNFLYALRFLFERKIRNKGFLESDFFQKDTTRVIEICLEIDISDHETDFDSQNIISKIGKERDSGNLNSVFIKVIANFDENEFFGNPKLFWGNQEEELQKIPGEGTFCDLDRLFHVVYVDPLIDLDKIFSLNKRKIFSKQKTQSDGELLEDINVLAEQINSKISTMESVTKFQEILTNEYHNLKNEDISVVLRSEMVINGVFNDLHPYITKNTDVTKKLYPTSGDGRKKILAYSLLNHITEEFNTNRTIPIFLIEEPENSLHRSMQIALSKQLFNQEIYRYFVMSTHSSEMLYEMDKATLIRLCNEDRTIAKSFLYKVSEEFSKIKRELNESLTTALFADRVLLIEGPSEKVLFEKILQEIQPNYELEGGYILQVDGIKFKPYYKTLINLGIICIIKTDNDLKETTKNSSKQFEYIGYNRCVGLLDGNEWKKWEYENGYIAIDYSSSDREDKIKEWKKSNFTQIQKIQQLRNKNIYLSKVDLENDLNEAIPETLELWRNLNHDAVPYLQKQKLIRMIKLCDFLKEEDCQKIYNHSLFECLKKLTGDF